MIKINLAKIVHEFETETCSRCGGSGHYSYCQQYGTRCFKCQGRKTVLTKRGAAASQLYERMASKPLSQIRPGDTIWNQDGVFHKSGWQKVVEVIRGGDGCYSVSPDGGRYDPIDSYTLVMKHTAHHGLTSQTLFRVRQTPGQRMKLRREALRYQSTLSKTGKPRQHKNQYQSTID